MHSYIMSGFTDEMEKLSFLMIQSDNPMINTLSKAKDPVKYDLISKHIKKKSIEKTADFKTKIPWALARGMTGAGSTMAIGMTLKRKDKEK